MIWALKPELKKRTFEFASEGHATLSQQDEGDGAQLATRGAHPEVRWRGTRGWRESSGGGGGGGDFEGRRRREVRSLEREEAAAAAMASLWWCLAFAPSSV